MPKENGSELFFLVELFVLTSIYNNSLVRGRG